MTRCKFCLVEEGALGRTGKPAHINRDTLCGPCATLLDKVKYQPEKVSVDDMKWFDKQCLLNYERGLFVPVAQRRALRVTHPPKWHCDKCGTSNVVDQDFSYKKYCVKCADEVRHNRKMPPKSARKTRSDKDGKHRAGNGAISPKNRGIGTGGGTCQ